VAVYVARFAFSADVYGYWAFRIKLITFKSEMLISFHMSASDLAFVLSFCPQYTSS
jgi:hypothetical protein